jgi:hypothetical protein
LAEEALTSTFGISSPAKNRLHARVRVSRVFPCLHSRLHFHARHTYITNKQNYARARQHIAKLVVDFTCACVIRDHCTQPRLANHFLFFTTHSSYFTHGRSNDGHHNTSSSQSESATGNCTHQSYNCNRHHGLASQSPSNSRLSVRRRPQQVANLSRRFDAQRQLHP